MKKDDNTIFIVGYHGTTEDGGNGILKNGYNPSVGNKEWLGKGIYFYYDFNDAYKWRDAEAIMSSVIKLGDKEYFDWDTDAGSVLYNRMEEYVIQRNKETNGNFIKFEKSQQENQCLFMQKIWELLPYIQMMSASFAVTPKILPILTDKRNRRREFCLRDNSLIKHTHIILRGDLND